jgi:Molecular chaperone (small heat shock protein)
MGAINRWDPFQEAISLREAMNQLFEGSFVRDLPTNRLASFTPAIDLSETSDAFIVEASLPGLKAEDINVSIEDNVLTISGELQQKEEHKERNYHRVERRYGSFRRSIALPNSVQAEKVEAKLENGVLHLNIPKAEEAKPRRITVNVAA